MKCGNCQAKIVANSAQPRGPISFASAAYPISTGAAPGTAPITVLSVLTRLSGV